MKLLLITVLIFFTSLIKNAHSLTEPVSTSLCLGIPSTPFTVIGANVYSEKEKGRKMCYYAPKNNDNYFYIKINKLNLKGNGKICPKFKLASYSKVRTERMTESETDIQIDWQVPEALTDLFIVDCTNYTKNIGKIFSTKSPGDKIELDYDPGISESLVDDAYDFSLSSYVTGQSYSCDNNGHLCWGTDHICLDESLMCDNYDNCYDNSDEDAYKCTQRIGNLPMPLFAIIIVACILFLIFIFMVIILMMRSQRNQKGRKKANWREYGDPYNESLAPTSYMS